MSRTSLSIRKFGVYDSQTILDIISEETMQHPPIVEYVAPQARERGRQETTRENILEILAFRLIPRLSKPLDPL